MTEEKKKYEYSQISIPKSIKVEAEKVMNIIGCRTMTMFASMAIKRYIAELQNEHSQV